MSEFPEPSLTARRLAAVVLSRLTRGEMMAAGNTASPHDPYVLWSLEEMAESYTSCACAEAKLTAAVQTLYRLGIREGCKLWPPPQPLVGNPDVFDGTAIKSSVRYHSSETSTTVSGVINRPTNKCKPAAGAGTKGAAMTTSHDNSPEACRVRIERIKQDAIRDSRRRGRLRQKRNAKPLTHRPFAPLAQADARPEMSK